MGVTEFYENVYGYGIIRYFKGKRLYNDKALYEFNKGKIKAKELVTGKDIWICGGASIVQQLMQDGLIDKFYISIIPTILGSGIRLFGPLDVELKLKLVESRNYNGITEVVYEKREIPIVF